MTLLALKLHGGLEEVDVESEPAVNALQQAALLLAFVAGIADELAHDGPVLLFDIALVVLSVRTRAGELDPVLIAVLLHEMIDELASIVRVDASDREGQPLADAFYRVDDRSLAS